MAYENVRPFYVDTMQFDNALSGLFGALKKKREDEAYAGLLDSLTGGAPTIGNALSAPAASSVSTPTSAPSVPPVLQAGYGRESGGPAPVNALAGNRSAPAAIRYNNPGAMWPGPSSQKFGAVGSDVIGGGNKIAIFKDPESGAAAQFDLFARKYAGKPLGAAIAQWSGGNSSPAYTATIAKAMGMDPNTVITPEMMRNPQVAIPLAKAMAKWESGRDFPLDDSGWQRAHRMALGGPVQGQGQAQAPQAAPSMPQVADASGGQDQARLIAWARANPGHPMAQAITKELVGQRLDPTAGIKLQQAQANLQGTLTEQQRASLEFYGKQAAAVSQLPEGSPQRAMAWKALLSRHASEHPGEQITPEEADPVTGPQLMAAQAGAVIDPNARRRQDLDMRKTEAEIKALEQKDVLNEAIAGMLRGANPEQGGVQKQSFNGAPPAPGVVLTGAGDQPQAQEPMVDTPMGKMPASRAQQLGFAMALAGKGDAGKMLYDPAQGELQKKTSGDLEEKIAGSAAQLARLNDIQKSFDPKFLDIANRFKMVGAGWTAKLGGKLDPQTTADLQRFAAFRSASVANLNAILKEVSGAAVTPQEYERIQADQPVAGTGIFDGDDPVTYQAKMQRVTASLKSAVARYNFMRSNKLNFDKNSLDKFIALDDVPALIDRRGAEIEQQIRQSNPKADQMSIDQLTRQQIQQEFGI